jgi:hypothetical protein
MKFRNTLILLVILIALSVYLYVVEIKQYEKEKQQEENAEQIFHFETDSVESFTVKNQYGNFEFKKIQGEWRITSPVYTDAEENTVTSALNSLKNAKKERDFVIKPQELKNYGLADGAMLVNLTLSDGTKDTVLLGDKTPVGSSVFAAKVDTIVYTVPENIKTSLDKKLFDWRFKNLLQFKRDDVNKIIVKKKNRTWEFDKIGSSDWQINSLNRPADAGKLNSLLSKLSSNRAKAFVDEDGVDLKKYGLSSSAYQIELILGPEKGKKILSLSSEIKDKYYAKDDSRKPIFEIDSTLLKDIDKPLSEFRSKDFVKLETDEVDKIVLEYADTTMTCEKDTSGEWYLAQNRMLKLKKFKVTSFLSNIRFTKIKEYVEDDNVHPGRFGLENPTLQIQLYKADNPLLMAKFGKSKGDQIYAMNDQYPSIYLVARSEIERLKLKQNDIIDETAIKPDTVSASMDN